MTCRLWIIFLIFTFTSQWQYVVEGRLTQHYRSALDDERLTPDAEIDAFMRSHNIRYPQVLDPRQQIKDEADLQYYYDYKDLSAALHPYRGQQHPPPAIDEPVKPLKHQPLAIQPLANHAQHSLETSIDHKQPKHINSESAPQHMPLSEDSKINVESRASAGHVGANEVAALAPGLSQALVQDQDAYGKPNQESSIADVYLIAVIAGCAIAAVSGLALTGVCWYRIHKRVQAASDVEYPAYGVTGPAKEKCGPPGDRKLAQSAQMYHYQHQKQQMIASERLGPDHPGGNGGGSEGESDEECEEGDYTVFECPGLATAGEMEVRNPLFNDQTPNAQTPVEK